MKTEKRVRDNRRSGMALPAVLIILMIVSILGTAMYAYSMQSIRSVRFASSGKKAEYLARAGVESAAYAYQQATNHLGNPEVNSFFNAFNASEDNKMESNKVYLVWDSGINDYKYLLDTQIASYSERDVIGYFTVSIDEVSTSKQIKVANFKTVTASTGGTTAQKIDESTKDIRVGIKVFNAVGHSGDVARAKTAYLNNSFLCCGPYYGNNGIIDGKFTDASGAYGSHSTVLSSQGANAGTPFVQSGSYQTASKIYFKWKWLSSWFNISETAFSLDVSSETIPFSLAYSAGNMIINKPEDANAISFLKNQSNFVSFVGLNNVFCQTGIDTDVGNGRFNSIVLKGKNIVIDGDVELYAYGFTRTSASLFNNIGKLNDMLNGKYRLGTVTVACVDDYAEENPYSTAPYKYNRSGKVYFGGNVYVNITMPSVGTYRYKAFSAGDVYYFDADYKNTRQALLGLTDGTVATDAGNGGIDLLRYFLEYSIATNKYSVNVLGRFSDVLDFYYGNSGDEKTLVQNGTTATRAYVQYPIDATDKTPTGGPLTYNAMRKVDQKFSSVTGKNSYGDTFSTIVPPNPGDASGLRWGRPDIEETTTAGG